MKKIVHIVFHKDGFDWNSWGYNVDGLNTLSSQVIFSDMLAIFATPVISTVAGW